MKKITEYLDFIAKCIFCYAACHRLAGIGRVIFILLIQLVYQWTCDSISTVIMVIFCHTINTTIVLLSMKYWIPEPQWAIDFRKEVSENRSDRKTKRKEIKEKKLAERLKINSRLEILDL